MMPEIHQGLIAIVPVRAGSKGLANKNIRLLDDMPLYLHAVKQGLRTVGKVLLSTDIKEITQQDLPPGCTLCSRPMGLAGDDIPMASVIMDLIQTQHLQNCTLVLLQATSPLRDDEDIVAAIAKHGEGKHDLIMSVVARDRSVLKYGTIKEGDFIPIQDPSYCFENRQKLPMLYGPNGAVYVFTAQQFLANGGFPCARLGTIQMPLARSLDIDTLDDFIEVEKIMITRRQAAKELSSAPSHGH